MDHAAFEKRNRQAILVLSTLGTGSSEERRIIDLIGNFPLVKFPFDRKRKIKSFTGIISQIFNLRPQLVVMEGTGIAGGIALIMTRLLFGQRYVVSSGDAVGPWVGGHYKLLGILFGIYERALIRLSSGFIGWTPYLVGRALTFGVPRAMTAAGWSPFQLEDEKKAEIRIQTRKLLGIPQNHIVIGIAGSMVWSRRHSYCYGLELVEAAKLVSRSDVTFLLIGDGTGKTYLEKLASSLIPGRIVFTGRVAQEHLPNYYVAMDIGSLPQSVDQVGSFRYTTKLSEYLAFQVPVITGQIPLAYDLDSGWLWRLPGNAPWDRRYIQALASLIEKLTKDELHIKRVAVPRSHPDFCFEKQVERTTAFINDLMEINAKSK